MIHAAIAHRGYWDAQWEPFAQQYRVIRYDMRGFGKSVQHTDAPFNMRADLRAVLDHLGIISCYLMGASMGGGIAVDFALEHPEMVDALIAVVPGLSGAPEPDASKISPHLAQLWQAADAAEKAGDHDRLDELALQVWIDGPNRTPDQVNAVVRERVRAMLHENHAAALAEGTPVRLDPPAYGRLAEIHCPTLALAGDEDVPKPSTM